MNAPFVKALRVFLADDSALMRDTIEELLVGLDFVVVGHGNTPQDCIDGIRNARPDVIILDAQLEGGTGISVLRALQPLAGCAVVVFTSDASPRHRRRYLNEGAQAVLDKSTEFGRLADTCRASCQAVQRLAAR